jgi:hypothetical protein
MESLLNCELLHTVLVVFCALPVFWVLNVLSLSTSRGMTIRELSTLPLFALGIVATIWIIVDACLMAFPMLRSNVGIHHLINGIDAYSPHSEAPLHWRDMVQTSIFAVINATFCVAILSLPAVVHSDFFQAYSDWVMTHITTWIISDGQQCTVRLNGIASQL